MSLLVLDLRSKSDGPRKEAGPPIRLRVTYTNVDQRSFPGRGLLYSFLVHEIVVFSLLLAPQYFRALDQNLHVPIPEAVDQEIAEHVVYLPRLGGGAEGKSGRGASSAGHRRGSHVKPARKSPGFSYPGPQTIISNPPMPTNYFQTILQPALKNPPVLTKLIPMPNIVRTKRPSPLPIIAERAEPSSPALPALQAPIHATPAKNTVALAAPEVAVPAIAPVSLPTLPVSAPGPNPLNSSDFMAPMRALAPHQTQRNVPLPNLAPTPAQGADLQDLLALSPAPAPPQNAPQVPAAVARGSFSISPGAGLQPVQDSAGSSNQGSRTASTDIGVQGDASPGLNAMGGSNGSSAQTELPGSGMGGAGIGTGTGKAVGGGMGENGQGSGQSSVAGAGRGSGNGERIGSGNGGGAAPGTGAFPGITIEGGQLTGPVTNRVVQGAAGPTAQHSYGMTIVSTASSGGGLADFGVFSQEQVYTVYLDMRSTIGDQAPSWILQCALDKDMNDAPASTGEMTLTSQDLVPPFPLKKEHLLLPAALLRKYQSRLVVIYGVLDKKGKLLQLKVKQSPDPELNQPLLQALNKWVFRPAKLGGSAVAVKVLLGIPLWMPAS